MALSVVAAVGFSSGLARGQIISDEVPYERTVPVRTQIEEDIEKSRWNFGAVHLLPVLTMRNTGYDSNVFGSTDEPVSDYTADVRFGVKGVLPLGPKMYARFDATPEYIWYDKLTDLRTWGGLYRAELLGFFNRATVRVGGYGSRTSSVLSSESEERVVQDLRDANGAAEVEIAGPLVLFGGAEWQQIRNRGGGAPEQPGQGEVELLDRTEEVARGGVRWVFSPRVNVSAEVEETRTEFVLSNPERANRSTAYLLGVHYDRPRFYVNLTAGYREGRGTEPGTSFPEYRTGTGTYFVSWFLAHPVEVLAYGHRGVVYGRFVDNSYFFETRNGVGVNLHVGLRILLHGFGEYGTNGYPVPVEISEGVSIARRDIAKAWGGGLSFNVFRSAAFTVIAREDRYTSNIPELGRRVFRVTTGFTLEGDFSR